MLAAEDESNHTSHMLKVIEKKATPKRPVRNLSAFISAIERVTVKWAPYREFYPWFRGHGDATWSLIPSVYRSEYREILEENQYRYDFRLRSLPYLASTAHEPTNEWEWYFLMQHHGLPTRLLDWTESALVALYFALRDTTGKNHAAVWVLDPWALNREIGRKGNRVLTPGIQSIQNYLPALSSKRTIPNPPIAIRAPLNSQRITAQRGVFTIHGNTRKPLEKYTKLKPYLAKIEIARTAIPIIKEQLAVAGITETTVFPELTGLCRELLDYWKFQLPE